MLSHLYLSQMSNRIGLGSGADIPALHISDHHKALFLTVINGLLIGDQAFDAELFIHGDLRLHRRNQIADRVNDPFIILPNRLTRSLQRLAVFLIGFLLDISRNILQHRVQPHNDGSIRLFDLLHKLINHLIRSFPRFFTRPSHSLCDEPDALCQPVSARSARECADLPTLLSLLSSSVAIVTYSGRTNKG